MKDRDHAATQDVAQVRREFLGPSADNGPVHDRTRLEEGAGDEGAMEILAEAAGDGVFAPRARLCAPPGDDVPDRIAEAPEVPVRDACPEAAGNGHGFPLQLPGGRHVPVRSRLCGRDRGGLRRIHRPGGRVDAGGKRPASLVNLGRGAALPAGARKPPGRRWPDRAPGCRPLPEANSRRFAGDGHPGSPAARKPHRLRSGLCAGEPIDQVVPDLAA